MGGSWTMHMYEMDETNAARLRSAQTELGNARLAQHGDVTIPVLRRVPFECDPSGSLAQPPTTIAVKDRGCWQDGDNSDRIILPHTMVKGNNTVSACAVRAAQANRRIFGTMPLCLTNPKRRLARDPERRRMLDPIVGPMPRRGRFRRRHDRTNRLRTS